MTEHLSSLLAQVRRDCDHCPRCKKALPLHEIIAPGIIARWCASCGIGLSAGIVVWPPVREQA